MPATSSPQTLLDLIQTQPSDRIAVVDPDLAVNVTYGALREQVSSVAEALASLEIARGDRIAMALPNGVPAIVCFLAAASVGTAAPLNPAYRTDEFRFFLEDTAANVLIVSRDSPNDARQAASDKVRVVTADMDASGNVALGGLVKRRTATGPSPNHFALILHTSGSTGRPKRVPLRHRNLAVSVGNVVQTYGLGSDDVSLCIMPLFHVHGLVASLLATLASGGTVVVPARFNPLGFWRLVREYDVTWYSAVPTMHRLLLARAATHDHPDHGRLRFVRSCSASLPPDVMVAMEEAFEVPVVEAYGMTEAAHQMASNPLPPGVRKPGSVGLGTGVQIGIMDLQGKLLDTGRHGEVVIQGPNVIDAYENDPAANAASFSDGWFRTGDQGYLDSDGYLTLVGRIKELINRGGEKISPREVDEALLSHPAVEEAVAFGVPHEMWGEVVEAAVVLRQGSSAIEDQLRAHCSKRLAEFKCPRRIHIVDTIPRTATGKVQRRLVAERYSDPAL